MNDSNKVNSLKHSGARHTRRGRKAAPRAEKTLKTKERRQGKKDIQQQLEGN